MLANKGGGRACRKIGLILSFILDISGYFSFRRSNLSRAGCWGREVQWISHQLLHADTFHNEEGAFFSQEVGYFSYIENCK